jgi:HEAT repeat protein
MRKLLGVSLLLLAAVAVALALLPSVRHQLAGRVAGDPVADGEPLRYWVYLVRAGETKEERAAAARALGEFGPEAPAGAAAALADALGDPEPLVRRDAATALGRLGPAADATPRLLAALGDPDQDVRAAAAGALGETRPDDPAALTALLKATGDSDTVVRVAAIMAVGRYGDRAHAAVPALIDVLRQGDTNRGSPHEAAVLALKAVGPASLPALSEALGRADARTRLGALKALELFGPAAGSAARDVERRLADEDPLVALEAVQCLWAIERKPDRAVPAARAYLATKEANPRRRGQIRAKAIYVLGEVGPAARSAAGDLLAILKEEPETHLRVHAARALGKMGPDPEIVQGLQAAARADRDPEVCQVANEALKKLGES